MSQPHPPLPSETATTGSLPAALRVLVTAGLVAGALYLLLLVDRTYRTAQMFLDPADLAAQALPRGKAAQYIGGIPGLGMLFLATAGLLTGAVLLSRSRRGGPAGRVVAGGGAGFGVLLGLWVQVDPQVRSDWTVSPWAAIGYLAATLAAGAVLVAVFTRPVAAALAPARPPAPAPPGAPGPAAPGALAPPAAAGSPDASPLARRAVPIQLALVAVAVVGVAALVTGYLVEPGPGDNYYSGSASAPSAAASPGRPLERPVTFQPVAAQTPGPCPATRRGLPSQDGTTCYELDEGLAINQFSRVSVQPPDPVTGSTTWSIALSVRAADRAALGQLTGRIAGQQPPRNEMAVVASGRVVTAIQVAEAITGGEMTISMGLNATRQETQRLAAAFGG